MILSLRPSISGSLTWRNLFTLPFFGTGLQSSLPGGQGSPAAAAAAAAASLSLSQAARAAKQTLLEVLIGKVVSPYLEAQANSLQPPLACIPLQRP